MRSALSIGLAVLVLTLGIGCQDEPSSKPPVVLVMIDTLRADYLGAYGFQGPVSPNIDALAKQAIVFEQCAAQSPWTKPSIASLFTGLYPEVHKVLTEGGKYRQRGHKVEQTDALSRDATTLAEAMSVAGYATGGFVANPWLRREHGFAQGFDDYDTRDADNETPGTMVVSRALEWLDRQEPDNPFFLYLHFMDVHGPYTAPDEDYVALAESPSLGPARTLPEERYQRIPPYMREPAWAQSPEARELRTWRGRYAAGVRSVDREIGKVLERLRADGRFDDALIVITSDHGEELFEHGHWDHGYRGFEHQVHVPLIVKLPGNARAGSRSQIACSVIDVMPTLVGQAGATAVPGVQGRDVVNALATGDDPGATFVEAIKWRPKMRVVRTARHKLIFDGDTRQGQLFDLVADPDETNDIAQEQPQVVQQLLALLARHVEAGRAHPGLEATQGEVPPEVAERLRNLGYLD